MNHHVYILLYVVVRKKLDHGHCLSQKGVMYILQGNVLTCLGFSGIFSDGYTFITFMVKEFYVSLA